MEKFRLHQAQELMKVAGKSKITKEKLMPPEEGKIKVKTFGEIINDMIELEEFIYTSRPSHKLDNEDAKLFCERILKVREEIDDMLAEFGVIEKESIEEEIKKLSDNLLILTSKSNFKKALMRMGVESRQILVAGVPLEIEDMKVINPNIPENALEPIKKKIKHLKNDIHRKMDRENFEKILVIVEDDKIGEILIKRAKELYDAQGIILENLKDTDPHKFSNLLSQI